MLVVRRFSYRLQYISLVRFGFGLQANSYSDFAFYTMQVEAAQPLSKLCLEFPDLYIGKNLEIFVLVMYQAVIILTFLGSNCIYSFL